MRSIDFCLPFATRGFAAGIFAAALFAGAGCTVKVRESSANQNQSGKDESRTTIITGNKVIRFGGKNVTPPRTLEQSITAAGIRVVDVKSPYGAITFVPSKSADTITLHAEIALSDNSLSEAERKKYLAGFSIEEKNEGGIVHISAKPPADFPKTLGFQATFRVGVPKGGPLALYAESENGAVRIEGTNTTGDVDARSEYGAIVVKGAGYGADIEAHTSNGAVRIENPGAFATKEIVAESEYGAITVSGQAETIEAKSGNGAVTVLGASRARTVSAQSDYGSVKVKECGGEVDAQTGNGSVFISGHPTKITGKSDYGSVEADLATVASPQNIELTSSNGAVRLTVAKTANVKIKANTSNGSISTIGVQGEKSGDSFEKSFSGVLGTGASEATLRSDFGSISITAR